MEEMASKKHVDPGVTAAVQTGQQHGDDKGHCCRGEKTALTKCKEQNTHCIPTVWSCLKLNILCCQCFHNGYRTFNIHHIFIPQNV